MAQLTTSLALTLLGSLDMGMNLHSYGLRGGIALSAGSQHVRMRSACRGPHFSAAGEQHRSASPLLMPCTPQMGLQHTHAAPCNGFASATPQQPAAMPPLQGIHTTPWPRLPFSSLKSFLVLVLRVFLAFEAVAHRRSRFGEHIKDVLGSCRTVSSRPATAHVLLEPEQARERRMRKVHDSRMLPSLCVPRLC